MLIQQVHTFCNGHHPSLHHTTATMLPFTPPRLVAFMTASLSLIPLYLFCPSPHLKGVRPVETGCTGFLSIIPRSPGDPTGGRGELHYLAEAGTLEQCCKPHGSPRDPHSARGAGLSAEKRQGWKSCRPHRSHSRLESIQCASR